MRKHPTATSTSSGGARRRASGRAASAATGHDGHGQRRRCRRAVPALDQEQDEEEQRRRERGRQQSEGEVGTQRRTMSVRCGREYGGHGERGWDRHHRDRHLHHEDRLPREGLGQQPTDHRSARRADHACGHPRSDAAPLAVLGDQELEAADQGRRPAECLEATGREQYLDRRCRRTPRGGACEHRDTDGTEDPRSRPREQQGHRHRDEPQHEIERDQHPGDLGDRGVQVAQDVGQGERHDRGVRQHQCHRHREQRSHGTTHPRILAPRLASGRVGHDGRRECA